MDWKARIDLVQEVNQGNMQIDAVLGDVDEDPRTDYPWTQVYDKEWLSSRSNAQVRQDITEDMTNYAQSLASSTARIDSLKALWEGQVIDLDVSV